MSSRSPQPGLAPSGLGDRPAEHATGWCRYCGARVQWTNRWGGFWLTSAGTTNTERAWCPQRPGWHHTDQSPYP